MIDVRRQHGSFMRQISRLVVSSWKLSAIASLPTLPTVSHRSIGVRKVTIADRAKGRDRAPDRRGVRLVICVCGAAWRSACVESGRNRDILVDGRGQGILSASSTWDVIRQFVCAVTKHDDPPVSARDVGCPPFLYRNMQFSGAFWRIGKCFVLI